MVYPIILKRKLFFELMCEAEIFGIKIVDSQIEHFLIYAGAIKLPVPQTIKNWIDTERCVQTKRYFGTNNYFKHTELFNNLRSEPESALKSLQEKFKYYKRIFSYVDTETSDLDKFCKSIINQFSGFVGLPMPYYTRLNNDDT